MEIIYNGEFDPNKNDFKISIGDSLLLKKEDVTSKGFENSTLGKIFSDSTIDGIKLVAYRKEWGEVYFKLELTLNDKSVTNDEYYWLTDGSEKVGDDSTYFENGDYQFLRYLIKSGNCKLFKKN